MVAATANCRECRSFFAIPEDADDFEPSKGDCVREEQDDKGKYWKAKPIRGDNDASKCPGFIKRIGG